MAPADSLSMCLASVLVGVAATYHIHHRGHWSIVPVLLLLLLLQLMLLPAVVGCSDSSAGARCIFGSNIVGKPAGGLGQVCFRWPQSIEHLYSCAVIPLR